MVVDGELFPVEIEGFDYELGCTYRIKMQLYDPTGVEPQSNASQYGYRLVEVLDKIKAIPEKEP